MDTRVITSTTHGTVYCTCSTSNRRCNCAQGSSYLCYDCGPVVSSTATTITIDEAKKVIDVNVYSRSLSIPPLVKCASSPKKLVGVHNRVVRFASRERGIGTRNYHKNAR